MSPGAPEVIVVDTNVIIRLIQDNQFHIIGALPDVHFVAPDEVIDEVTYPDQRDQLLEAISDNRLEQISITDQVELAIFVDVSKRVEPGEAACLAIAQNRGYSLLSDEKRRFEREAHARLGSARLLRTKDLLARAKDHNLVP